MSGYQITDWCHSQVERYIRKGDLCIDATMGNGNDTEFLCRAVGETGRVLAFDIQPAALERTKTRLREKLGFCNYELLLESHERMNVYAEAECASCIMFNLGYLPSGDHRLSTRVESTLRALEQALGLVRRGGVISVCIYSGGDSGFEERDAVLAWLRQLDGRNYLALVTQYYNRPNDPPIPALILKL